MIVFNVIVGFLIGILIALIVFGRVKGKERTKRFCLFYTYVGFIFLVLGVFIIFIVKGPWLMLSVICFLFGATCLMFSDVYSTLHDIQDKSKSK